METPIERAFCWPLSALSEAPASPRASASCYRSLENIFVVAVVVDEGSFGNIERQIFAADVVIRADNRTLQCAPEAFNRVRMDRTDNVLARRVRHEFMREGVAKEAVAAVFVGREQRNFRADGFANEAVVGLGIRRRDHAGHDVPFAAHGTDNWRLAGTRSAALTVALVPMLVLRLAANVGLVNLDHAHELLKFLVLKRGADAMAHIPSRLVASEAHDAVNLAGADPLFASEHHMDHAEPLAQVHIRVLEDRANKVREAIRATLAAIRALPAVRHALERVSLERAAAGARDAIRPALRHKVGIARRLVWERLFPLGDAHLHDLGGLFGAGHGGYPSVMERLNHG